MSRQSVKASIDAYIKRDGVQAITGQILNGVLNLMLAFSADKEEVESALDEKYEKPAGGIPKTDLSEGVQSSLAKADTALQTHQDISGKADKSTTYTKTQVNGLLDGKVSKETGKGLSSNDYTNADKEKVSHLPNNTESALGLKQDTLQSGENIKTINGQSILGGGNIEIQGGGSSVPVVDNLTSTSKTSALSANQGRALKGMIDGKQDAISDLSAIRSGAQDGTAALQSFSAIPSWAKQPQKPTYTAAEVNALPSSTTIPSKTSELTNDSGFLTTHQDISGKADKVQIATSNPIGGLNPNTLYNLGALSGAVTIKLASAISGVASHFFVTFETGDTAPTITWGSGITSWFGGSAPTINANKHYEVSVLNGVAIAMEV